MGIGSVLQPSLVVSAGATRLSTCNPRKFSLAKASSLFNHRISFATTSVCRNRPAFRVKAEQQSTTEGVSVADISEYKNILLPITDKNPYLSEGTKQAVATSTTLAKKNGASITVVVIDESAKDAITDHETRLSSIRWHLSEGGFDEFGLMERLGEGKKPTAIIGEVADDMNLDLVVMSMESIHSKHVDGNLLAEFIPCPVLLLPL